MAKQEFTYGADYKFTPEEMTYNGVKGVTWIQRRMSPTGWVYMGRCFLRASATRAEVVGAHGLVVRPNLINAKT